jgi:GAF domain-containing protein
MRRSKKRVEAGHRWEERKNMHREVELAAAFKELSSFPDRGFEEARYTDLLAHRCAALLEVEAVGVLLTGQEGELAAVAASAETVQLLQLVQLQFHEGPGIASFRTAAPTRVPDLRTESRWDTFRSATLKAGFAAVHAIPLRLRAECLGSLCLFRHRPGALSRENDRVGESLAATATSVLLAHRALAKAETLAGQLQTALHSRVVIEQAKGILAERHGLATESAFELMRAFARHDRRRLDDVARAVIDRSATVARLLNRASESTVG